jgi:taurine transport system substrate-binding protein
MAYSGSTQITVGMSAGVEKELFWIAKNTDITEGLVVHIRSRIEEPRQLRGKRIAAPFWSTHHFHLLFALEQFNLTESDVDIYDMRPGEILAAWNAGGLDAAFIGLPTLERLLLSGRVLVWSGWLNRWGKATFDGFVVRRDWSAANPEFMRGFVRVLDTVNRNYGANADRWTSDSREIQTIVKLLGHQSNVVASLKLIKIPSLEEQLSIAWLGGGAAGGAAKTLQATAQYLNRFGMVEKVLPDYSPYITDRWAKAALQARQDATGAPRR